MSELGVARKAIRLLSGCQRVSECDHNLMDVIAGRAFEGPDVKAGWAGRDPSVTETLSHRQIQL
jgi:hypothetical protein